MPEKPKEPKVQHKGFIPTQYAEAFEREMHGKISFSRGGGKDAEVYYEVTAGLPSWVKPKKPDDPVIWREA